MNRLRYRSGMLFLTSGIALCRPLVRAKVELFDGRAASCRTRVARFVKWAPRQFSTEPFGEATSVISYNVRSFPPQPTRTRAPSVGHHDETLPIVRRRGDEAHSGAPGTRRALFAATSGPPECSERTPIFRVETRLITANVDDPAEETQIARGLDRTPRCGGH